MELKASYTSTGEKLFWHQEAMTRLRDGKGTPIHLHILPDDLCQDTCSFCSVVTRAGAQLPFGVINSILNDLVPLGLKAMTISGGGNPLLYKCKLTGKKIGDVIELAVSKGLQVGMICNGMKLKTYSNGRIGWLNLAPEQLDLLTWVRISMSGLDHDRKVVEVPHIDPSKTTLGFSWIMADIYDEPAEPNHGKVSTLSDIITPLVLGDGRTHLVEERLPWIETQIKRYVEDYGPKYVRLLCNCLEPDKITERHKVLSEMAERIAPGIAFSQFKPPRQPRACFKGYLHPVVNSDGFLYSCDSVVLNKDAEHRFNNKWRVCHWTEIAELFRNPIRSMVPNDICPGCVFSDQVDLIADVAGGMATPTLADEPEHSNFV